MKLFGFNDQQKEVEVDLDDPTILCVLMEVISGDEVMLVIRDDGMKIYDAAPSLRTDDFHDVTYAIIANGKWLIDKEEFLSRKSSYWMKEGW